MGALKDADFADFTGYYLAGHEARGGAINNLVLRPGVISRPQHSGLCFVNLLSAS